MRKPLIERSKFDLQGGVATIITGLICATLLLPISCVIESRSNKILGYLFLLAGALVIGRPILRLVSKFLEKRHS